MAPTYTYLCNNCGFSVDIMHGILEKKRPLCVVCDRRMRRQIGPGGGLIFKGKGFHCRDYSTDRRYRENQK